MNVTRFALWFTLLIPQLSFANSSFNMRQGVTDISENVYQLHMTIFLICCAIAVIVFGIMFWSIYHHRKSKGVKPAQFHESTKIEIIWTAIPFVILIVMAIPATKTLIAMEDTSKADITIKVTGSQWKWHYQYLTYNNESLDVDFYSTISTPQQQIDNLSDKTDTYLLEVDKPLVLPINKKVRFVLTSDDVIHSWWVPDFAVKKDAVPGFINEAWTAINEVGTYRGQCAELCGKSHGFMPIVVEAIEEEDFDTWLTEAKLAKQNKAQEELASQSTTLSEEELMSLGEQVYIGNCSVCHQPSGLGLPGVFPALKDSPIAIGDIKEHIDIILYGKSGTAMQAFAKQLSLKEIAAVVTYERNAWGNDTGDLVQPIDVSNAKTEGTEAIETPAEKIEATIEPVVPKQALDDQPSILTKEALMATGEKDYLTYCAACHQATGLGITGAFPALKDSPIAMGDVEQHIAIVVNGKPGTAMMGFAQQLSAQQLAAIITYERNAWGNDTGDLVQENQIEKFKKGEE